MGNFSKTSFKWSRMGKRLSKFDERFIKNHDEKSDKRYFLAVDVKYQKNLFSFHSDLPFSSERNKIKKCNSLFVTFMTRKTMLFT